MKSKMGQERHGRYEPIFPKIWFTMVQLRRPPGAEKEASR